MDAWKDSHCFMAATDSPAPYQYDASTGMEVPSNFAVQQHFNQFVTDNSYQLAPDLINIPDNYQPAFTGHLDMVGNMSYDSLCNNQVIQDVPHDFSTEVEDRDDMFSHHGDNPVSDYSHTPIDEPDDEGEDEQTFDDDREDDDAFNESDDDANDYDSYETL